MGVKKPATRPAYEFKQMLRDSTRHKSQIAEPRKIKSKSIKKPKFLEITSKLQHTINNDNDGLASTKQKLKADEYEEEESQTGNVNKKQSLFTKQHNLRSRKRIPEVLKPKLQPYDAIEVKKLSKEFPDNYWQFHANSGHGMINYINEQNPLELLDVKATDYGPISGMVLSPDGTMLASFSNFGVIKIWDTTELTMLQTMRDTEEKNIEEYYVGKFAPTHTHLIAGGKLKDRYKWEYKEEDNHILPCPLKIFDIITGKCVGKLEGHIEEILSIKSVTFKGENYYISSSQDGNFIKWKMEDDWITLKEKECIDDGDNDMAFTVSFLPNTGNKYFLATTDDTVKLYDFETGQLLQTFEELYSQYCDCGKFIHPVEPLKSSSKLIIPQHAYFITRGVEMLKKSEHERIDNVCILHKLIYPNRIGGKFRLETIRIFQHKNYISNSWLVRITSNGRYLAAPTMKGEVCIFNLRTGNIVAILNDHESMEIKLTNGGLCETIWSPVFHVSCNEVEALTSLFKAIF
ncbi:137_t:CDS:10 [Entrophospora sp. SA101]|nr:137_t:CDS:10 [Entrophospora sp. SA101]